MEVNWHRCYGEGWGDLLVPESFAHPAKFSRALIRRIYKHILAQGYVTPGDTVLDPFGGVGLGALHAMMNGLCWVGVELEGRFVGWGQQNIAAWNARFSALPNWSGQAVLLQGDSRRLCDVVRGAGAVVSSPPYSAALGHKRGEAGEKREATGQYKQGYTQGAITAEFYSDNPANLGNLPPGDHGAVVSSPPYAESQQSRDGNFTLESTDVNPTPRKLSTRSYFPAEMDTPGQLAAMPAGDVAGVVSSPPYEAAAIGTVGNYKSIASLPDNAGDLFAAGGGEHKDYGYTDGQLGGEQGNTFWSAARTIMQQCHAILRPGGVAVWVVKAFVRNKAIVDFPDQWRELGESCGFETLEWIRAWLVEDRGTQVDLWGNDHERKVERKSFFRRLYESKYPENSIDYEVVLVQRRGDLTADGTRPALSW